MQPQGVSACVRGCVVLHRVDGAVCVQSLKLLADILMARPNVRVMFEYVKSKRHLMLVMNLLRSSSRSIQHEAFHVFKVFVANPRKPDDIKSILVSNRDKLLRFLTAFLEERGAPPPLPLCGSSTAT